MMPDIFFGSLQGVLRVVVVGVLAYAALVIALRITGKRTLAKLNAFDLVVTVALGSILATVLLSKDVPLAEGVAGFLTLIVLQYIVTWLSVRSRRVSKMVKAEPRLLFHNGEHLANAMCDERLTLDEVLAAIRQHGHATVATVHSVILETDGSLSVTRKRDK